MIAGLALAAAAVALLVLTVLAVATGAPAGRTSRCRTWPAT